MFHVLIETGLIVSGGFAAFQIIAIIDHAMPKIASALGGRGVKRIELTIAPLRHRTVRSHPSVRWSGDPTEASATARLASR